MTARVSAKLAKPSKKPTKSSSAMELVTADGVPLLIERSDAVPLVHVQLTFSRGTVHDPVGKEGLSRLLSKMLRMGTKQLRASDVEDRVDSMGAQLSIGAGASYLGVSGVVVERNVEEFFQLIGELLTAPAFRPKDLAQQKRETLASLEQLCDDDRSLCGRHFRALAMGKHPYGRPIGGSSKSVRAVQLKDIEAQYRKLITAKDLVIGVAGPLSGERVAELCDKHFSRLPRRAPVVEHVAEPEAPKGLRIVVVDKPERTQTQVAIGTTGTHSRDRDHVPLIVANTAFGGLFSARLTQEVRVRRGLSYGASSSVGVDRARELWSMWTFPSATDAVGCIELQLKLLADYVAEGPSERELQRAKSYLIKSHAFEIDTADKRLDQRIDEIVHDLPKGYHDNFLDQVRAVDRASAHAAMAKRIRVDALAMVVVATAKDIVPALKALPGVSSVDVVPFDRI
jgi:zinc protease